MPLAIHPYAGFAFAALWLFVLGSVIGSFLNVVIHRLPAGMSLVHPGSHCPTCARPIRWYDNVPVLSWFLLRGRCRHCGGPIPIRYLVVESITAGLFVAVGIRECLAHGAAFPGFGTESSECWVACAYHLLLLCTLLTAAAIELDGHRVPSRLFFPAILVGSAAPLLWPDLHPVPAVPDLRGWVAGLADGMAGLAGGLLLGWLASALARINGAGLVLGLGCAGLFLGWQAAILPAVLSVAAHGLTAVCRPLLRAAPRLPATAWLAGATLGWILAC